MKIESYNAKNEVKPVLDGELFGRFQESNTLILDYFKPGGNFFEEKTSFLMVR